MRCLCQVQKALVGKQPKVCQSARPRNCEEKASCVLRTLCSLCYYWRKKAKMKTCVSYFAMLYHPWKRRDIIVNQVKVFMLDQMNSPKSVLKDQASNIKPKGRKGKGRVQIYSNLEWHLPWRWGDEPLKMTPTSETEILLERSKGCNN